MAEASEKTKHFCRICGYDFGSPVRDKYGLPQYDICDACGGEVGADDDTLQEVRMYRQKWLIEGGKWHGQFCSPPSDWFPEKCLKNIPPEWQ